MNSSAHQTEEKRGSPRMRTLKGGRVVLPNNLSTFECKVRNLSATGACIEMPSTLGVPNHFTLKYDDGSPSKVCNVIWRTDKRMGLRFES
ncbi:PilZ domain-containing protein [Flaviflagellibacter deserti]|jgi:hypothetical protein|uniref:PilZ domain-containing protein n=1 Tax=Flaviflagellibacter deserti TaxID=2267266 RepID=A0ABV9YZY9_9HYPH